MCFGHLWIWRKRTTALIERLCGRYGVGGRLLNAVKSFYVTSRVELHRCIGIVIGHFSQTVSADTGLETDTDTL